MKSGRHILWLALPWLLTGCLFDPRDPAPPRTSDPIQYLPRGEAVNVWANLEISLENNDSFGWDEAISAGFQYFPDLEAEAAYPGIFEGWGKTEEISFIKALYAGGVSISAQMRDDDFNVPPPAGTEVVWENVIYDLTVQSTVDGSSIRYRASAIINFRLEGNFWYISSWRDQQGESDPDDPSQLFSSMGVLRGVFGSNKSFNMVK